jgi:hypothetical protein
MEAEFAGRCFMTVLQRSTMVTEFPGTCLPRASAFDDAREKQAFLERTDRRPGITDGARPRRS